jgi:hypothetical protein
MRIIKNIDKYDKDCGSMNFTLTQILMRSTENKYPKELYEQIQNHMVKNDLKYGELVYICFKFLKEYGISIKVDEFTSEVIDEAKSRGLL